MALSVPLSRFTPQVGGGSAFYVRLLASFGQKRRRDFIASRFDFSAAATSGARFWWFRFFVAELFRSFAWRSGFEILSPKLGERFYAADFRVLPRAA